MRWGLGVTAAFVVCAGAPAFANDEVTFAAAPAWVEVADSPDPANLPADRSEILIFDMQHRIDDGRVWRYFDSAQRVASPEMLSQVGTITIPWQPHLSRLIVHRVEIIRKGETVDLTKTGTGFTVLQREEELEKRSLDGTLTATMAVEGLRVGDVLRVSYSVDSADPALAGQVQTELPLLTAPLKVTHGRARLIWPESLDLKLRSHIDGVALKPVTEAGFSEVSVAYPLAKLSDVPADAPIRFQHLPILEATSFADWSAVSKTMARLYATEGTIAPNGPIAGEVAKIKAATSDPRARAAAALQLVQDEVRYLYRGMDGGNYTPQTPADTWRLRFGDCKAKTLLLLAMLRDMGIESEAVLVSSERGDAVPARLPSAGVFDHVIVRAEIGGQSLWLDGTRSGAQLADIADTPPFRHVLPLRTAGAGLMPLELRQSARPDAVFEIDMDMRAGLRFPAPYHVEFKMRGDAALQMRAFSEQGNEEQIDQAAQKVFASHIGTGTLFNETIRYDPATGYATISADGITYPNWVRDGATYRYSLDTAITSLEFKPDRTRTAWRSIPVFTGGVGLFGMNTRIKLPDGTTFRIEGEPDFSGLLVGSEMARSAAVKDGVLTISESQSSLAREIEVAGIAAARDALTRVQARTPHLVSDQGAPWWELVEAGQRAKAFAPILAAYTKDIEQSPDKSLPLFNRAWFRAEIFDRQGAIEDLTAALAIDHDIDYLIARANHYRNLDEDALALDDYEAARAIEPGNYSALDGITSIYAERGDHDAALALIEDRVSADNDDGRMFMSLQADLLARAGRTEDALAAMAQVIEASPDDATALNSSCWLKGTNNVALDSALTECTRSIELGESPASALDSRALVHYRAGQLDKALADINAALAIQPEMAGGLYMRSIIHKAQGNAGAAGADLAAARTMWPRIEEEYRRWGLTH